MRASSFFSVGKGLKGKVRVEEDSDDDTKKTANRGEEHLKNVRACLYVCMCVLCA